MRPDDSLHAITTVLGNPGHIHQPGVARSPSAPAVREIRPDQLAAAGRLAPGTALRLPVMARHAASPRLVPKAIRLDID